MSEAGRSSLHSSNMLHICSLRRRRQGTRPRRPRASAAPPLTPGLPGTGRRHRAASSRAGARERLYHACAAAVATLAGGARAGPGAPGPGGSSAAPPAACVAQRRWRQRQRPILQLAGRHGCARVCPLQQLLPCCLGCTRAAGRDAQQAAAGCSSTLARAAAGQRERRVRRGCTPRRCWRRGGSAGAAGRQAWPTHSRARSRARPCQAGQAAGGRGASSRQRGARAERRRGRAAAAVSA